MYLGVSVCNFVLYWRTDNYYLWNKTELLQILLQTFISLVCLVIILGIKFACTPF